MEEQWQEALSGFDAVWQRVQDRTEAPALPETDRGKTALAALIAAVAQAEQGYRAAGAAAAGWASEPLRRMAGACAAEHRRLRAGWFLLYGQACAPTAEARPGGSLPQRLRQAYFLEKTVWEACDAAAVAAGDAALRALCAQAAQRSRGRLDALFALLCRALG